MVWWVHWGHRPNVCVACFGSRGGPSVGFERSQARHRGDGFLFRAGGCEGRCRCNVTGVLLFEVPVGSLHVLASRQSVPCRSCRLCEVLAEDAVFGKL